MKEAKLATEKQIEYIVSLVEEYTYGGTYSDYVDDGEPTEKLKNLPIWEAKKLIEELKSFQPKKYIWTFKEEYKNNEYVQKLNELLSKEEGAQPENFDQIPVDYNYYFMEGEMNWFSINLGLLIDNFEIYENAEEVYKEYLDENNRIKKHNTLLMFLLENWCPSHEIPGGDIITSGAYYW